MHTHVRMGTHAQITIAWRGRCGKSNHIAVSHVCKNSIYRCVSAISTRSYLTTIKYKRQELHANSVVNSQVLT